MSVFAGGFNRSLSKRSNAAAMASELHGRCCKHDGGARSGMGCFPGLHTHLLNIVVPEQKVTGIVVLRAISAIPSCSWRPPSARSTQLCWCVVAQLFGATAPFSGFRWHAEFVVMPGQFIAGDTVAQQASKL